MPILGKKKGLKFDLKKLEREEQIKPKVSRGKKIISIKVKSSALVAQMVKNLPAMRETWIQSLGGEDPLEKGMTTHSSTLAWRIPRTEEPSRLCSPWGCKESDTTEQLIYTK